LFQGIPQSPGAQEGVLEMDLIEAAHEREIVV
jgi:hypothetical protein